MENFITDFQNNSQHLQEDVISSVVQSYHQFNDAIRPFKGKNKIAVVGQSQFTRNHLADCAFSLKEVCETLMGCVMDIVKIPAKSDQTEMINNVSNKMENMFSNLMKGFEERLLQKIHTPANVNSESTLENSINKDKHVILIENDDDETKVYTDKKWNEVVSKNISKKLKGIPVDKTAVNRDGKGCMFFPSKDAQQKAKLALDSDFKVVTSSKPKRSVMPKLKIYNVEIDDKEYLKTCILEKNPEITDRMNNERRDSSFEIILIDSIRKYAIAKVTPDIRSAILNKGRVYVGMKGLSVKDHFHPLQCYACQKFGHKQGSDECEKASGSSTCLYCAKDHKSKDCADKRNHDLHKCSNCVTSENERYKNNAGHTATSLKCPLVMKETNALIRRTAGLEADESNLILS